MATKSELRAESEEGFLAEQAEDAKGAVARSLRGLTNTLTDATGIRSHAERHPWILVGSAIAAGFVGGALLSSSPRNGHKAEVAANNEFEPAPRSIPEQPAPQPAPKPEKSFLLSGLETLLLGVLTAALEYSVAAVLSAKKNSSRAGSSESSSDSLANGRETGDATAPENNSIAS